MSKIKKNIALSLLLLVGFFVCFNISSAASTDLSYTPLASISVSSDATSQMSADQYIKLFFQSFYALIVVLALLMVTKGGIKLMVSGDNASKRTEAWDDIEQAIWGLVLALSTWLILNILNPKLIPGTSLFSNMTLTTGATR